MGGCQYSMRPLIGGQTLNGCDWGFLNIQCYQKGLGRLDAQISKDQLLIGIGKGCHCKTGGRGVSIPLQQSAVHRLILAGGNLLQPTARLQYPLCDFFLGGFLR